MDGERRAAGPAGSTAAGNDTASSITAHVCGGAQVRRCADGGEHDMSAIVYFKDGGSVACARCGVTAMEIDMMELP